MIVLLWRVIDGFIRRPVGGTVATPLGDRSRRVDRRRRARRSQRCWRRSGRVGRGRRRRYPGHRRIDRVPDREPVAQPDVVGCRCTPGAPPSWWPTGARRADRPEHTLAAYELALQESRPESRCDVRLTRDGHLVCVHDRRVDRTPPDRTRQDMTLAELKQFTRGAWHASLAADGGIGDIRPTDPRICCSWCWTGSDREGLHRDKASGAFPALWVESKCWPCRIATGSHRRRRPTCPARW